MPNYKIVIKTLLPFRRSHDPKGEKTKQQNNGWHICNSVKKHLFQAFTAVSRSSSAEDGCTDTKCLLESNPNPFSLKKGGGAPGWISFWSFVVDMEWCRDVYICLLTLIKLFLYQTAPYMTCIVMIETVWKVCPRKKSYNYICIPTWSVTDQGRRTQSSVKSPPTNI